MKKILLTTTALATMATGSAFARENPLENEGLKIDLGGSLDTQAGFRSQKKEYTRATAGGLFISSTGIVPDDGNTSVFTRGITPGNRSVGFDTQATLYATVKNKTASGLVYGAHLGIKTTTGNVTNAAKDISDNTYLFMENDMGRVELGSNASAAQAMKLGAERVARATGGIDGDWSKYVELNTSNPDYSTPYVPPKVRASNFITGPSLVLDSVENGRSPLAKTGGNEKSRKLTYYTPEYNGFQAGVSYVPDSRNSANDYIKDLAKYTNQQLQYNYGNYTGVTVSNAVAGGVSWKGTLGKIHHVKLSVVGEYGKTNGPKNLTKANGTAFKNAGDVVVGGQWSYKQVGLAASYGWRGKSLSNKDVAKISSGSGGGGGGGVGIGGSSIASSNYGSGYFWTLGGSWTQGPWGTSLTYIYSKNNTNRMDLVSLGADYEVSPGLMPYAEISHFSMRQKRDYWTPDANRTGTNTPTITSGGTNVDIDAEGGNYANNSKNKGTAFILGTKINF